MAFTHYRTEGVFLKKDDRGEADQLFTIFTEDFGKLEILARAIRKIKSKLRSASCLFYLSEIEFIQGKTYKTLTDAILIEKFKNLRKNPGRLDFAYKIADSLDSLLTQEEKDDSIWRLILETFKRLNDLRFPVHDLQLTYYYFLWNLFSILGYAPEFYSCPVCGRKLLPETFLFLPVEGGVVCWRCFKNFKEEKKKKARGISVDTVKVLRIFLKEDWKILGKLKIEKKDKENLKEISEFYLDFLKEEFSKMEK